jgi:hypothetical protein
MTPGRLSLIFGEVEAALAIARPSCRNTTLNSRRDVFCTPNAVLTAERSRAAAIGVASSNRTSQHSASVRQCPAGEHRCARPRYLSAIGLEATSERLNDLLTLLAVVMIEVGGGLALALGLALSERPAESNPSLALSGLLSVIPTRRGTQIAVRTN